MSKKLCSILLAFAMIMLTITNAFAAVQFENVDGSTFKIENLKELGFISGYEDGSLRLDQYIKRSEFAKVLVNAFDKEQEAEAIKGKFKPFKDVDESHWANGIISIVKNLKGINNTQIINGYPDGTFRPEEHITNAEALKMLVCCVKGDLTEEMVKNAEWFESWVKWAIELGIIGADSDVPNIVDMNAKVTRGNVFTMFYNAFEEDEVERPIEKTEEKEPEKKTEDKKEEKSVVPDRHAGSRHDRYDIYPEYPYYPDLPIVPDEPPLPEVKTYSISIDSSANGIVTADKYSAQEGEIVTLRIMPNEGFKLDTLEVTDVFGNKVQLVNQWFVMPSSNVVVSAKFVEDIVEPVEFDKDNIKNIEIKSEPSKMNYVEGEKLDLSGLKVTLTDKNDNSVEVPYNNFLEYGIDVNPENGMVLGLEDNGKEITVSKSGIEAKTNPVEVKELEYNDALFASLEIITEPAKLSYKEKDQLDLTGLKVKLTDKNDKSKVVELKDFAANGITTVPSNEATLSLADNDKAITVKKGKETKTTTKKLEVIELTYDETKFKSLEIITEPAKLSYKEKDQLDLTGLKVKLTDSNGKSKVVELKDFAANGITTVPSNEATLSLADNGNAISVTKSSKTVETTKKLEIIVFNPDKIEGIKVKNQPNKMVYDEGMALDLDGMIITLTDENGLTKDVEFARGAETEYSKYIKTSIEDRDILGEEHNEKFIIVSLNQNPNIKTQTEILIVKHYFTIGYKGVWIGGTYNLDEMFQGKPIEDKVEDGSLWEYPSMNGQKIDLDRTGYDFIGWQTEDGREIKTPFIVTKDMIMVAKWRDKNQPTIEYLKEQFETAAKLSTSIIKDNNKESLGLEYNEKVITIVPAKMEAFNITEYNLINELQKLVKENFLTGYTINSKTRNLNSSLTENQILEYLIQDFAAISNVNVSGLDYSNKSQVSDKVKEILTTLAKLDKTVEVTVNLAKDDVNTTDIYKFVFLQYKDMSTSEVESINNFYNDLMQKTVNSVNQQGIWDNDPNNPDASVKLPVFKTKYDGNENLYTININTRYIDLLAKQTAGTGFKTAVVNFSTGGHVGRNGVVQKDLQKVKITQTGTGKSVIVDREQLNEIVHVNLSNMKSLLAPFSYIFMPAGKDVNTLSLQDLVGQEATFEYTYVNENYETYTVVRTVKFGTFTE